jgi:hypothetical protein
MRGFLQSFQARLCEALRPAGRFKWWSSNKPCSVPVWQAAQLAADLTLGSCQTTLSI